MTVNEWMKVEKDLRVWYVSGQHVMVLLAKYSVNASACALIGATLQNKIKLAEDQPMASSP